MIFLGEAHSWPHGEFVLLFLHRKHIPLDISSKQWGYPGSWSKWNGVAVAMLRCFHLRASLQIWGLWFYQIRHLELDLWWTLTVTKNTFMPPWIPWFAWYRHVGKLGLSTVLKGRFELQSSVLFNGWVGSRGGLSPGFWDWADFEMNSVKWCKRWPSGDLSNDCSSERRSRHDIGEERCGTVNR